MTRILFHLFILGLFAAGGTSRVNAQFYSGATNYAASSSQAYARGLSGSGDQGSNLRNFSVSSYNGGWGYGSGGGTSQQTATPWSSKYGSWIQPATSGVMQDSIARQQAYYSGSMQLQDIALRNLQYKRAAFDEMMYEKMNTPPPELVREEDRQSRLTRARNTPPESEIALGDPLNELLINIQRIQAREGVRGNSIPLDPDVVQHLNVTTTANNSGSNEFFKKNTMLEWPPAFMLDNFTADRVKIEADIAAMVTAQMAGKIDPSKAVDARKVIAVIKDKLFRVRNDVSFTDYAGALEFLTKLEKSIDVLAKPGGKSFVDGTYSAKGNTVGELVDHMTSKGLRFAKATPGYEPYYTAFYQSMVTYEIGMSRIVGDQSTYMYASPKK